MPGFSGVRRRSPSSKEKRKQRGVLLMSHEVNRLRAKLFEAGIRDGKRGKGLRRYVDRFCPPYQQP